MKQTFIYFLRHGKVHNPQNILYGRLPGFHLSNEGKLQIKKIIPYFRQEKIDVIYSSPTLRTKETAQIIAKALRKNLQISHYLNETKLAMLGVDLDKFHKEIQPKIYYQEYLKKGQESIDSQAERMMKFLKMVMAKYPGMSILAVSHGDPIMALKTRILKIDFSFQYKKENYLHSGKWIKLSCFIKNTVLQVNLLN